MKRAIGNFGIRPRPLASGDQSSLDLPGGTVVTQRRGRRAVTAAADYPPWPLEVRVRKGVEANEEDPERWYLDHYYGTVSGIDENGALSRIAPIVNSGAPEARERVQSPGPVSRIMLEADGVLWLKATVDDTPVLYGTVSEVEFVQRSRTEDDPENTDTEQWVVHSSWRYRDEVPVLSLPLRYSLVVFRAGGPGSPWLWIAG